jgi:hypothetical protein
VVPASNKRDSCINSYARVTSSRYERELRRGLKRYFWERRARPSTDGGLILPAAFSHNANAVADVSGTAPALTVPLCTSTLMPALDMTWEY